MHFDILVPDTIKKEDDIFGFGKNYLKTKDFEIGLLSANECKLCHIEEATPEVISSINEKGYSIIEMENCS